MLQANGLKLGCGTIVDATIIGAPGSTKNAEKARDPEMRQTKKNQQWYFGMRLHIGVDAESGLAHRAVVTAANVHDKHPLPDLLHGAEEQVYGDCAYASQQQPIASKAEQALDMTNRRVRKGSATEELERLLNRAKSRIRARVEHVFGVVKRLWGFGKVRYRGLAKNATRGVRGAGPGQSVPGTDAPHGMSASAERQKALGKRRKAMDRRIVGFDVGHIPHRESRSSATANGRACSALP